jgi:glycosyltransferase involved in cell wall biosynthesis
MPFSHNLIEGMAAGCIPILNYPDHLYPPLEEGAHCLSFKDAEGLSRAVKCALEMPPQRIEAMRRNVMAYYERDLAPEEWLKRSVASDNRQTTLLVNSEEVSMAIAMPDIRFV